MAKKINYAALIGTTVKTIEYGEALILDYEGKDSKGIQWYRVRFKNTSNEELQRYNNIRKGEIVDSKLKKLEKSKKVQRKLKKRNKLIKNKPIQNYVRKKEDRCILVLDIATYKTGYSVIFDDYIDSSGLVQSENECLFSRAKEQIEQLRDKLKGYKIDAIVCESVYLGMNSDILQMLAEFRGMYQGITKRKFHIIAINSWKRIHNITGDRETQKARSIEIAENYLGEKVSGDDEADSVCIALYILNRR